MRVLLIFGLLLSVASLSTCRGCNHGDNGCDNGGPGNGQDGIVIIDNGVSTGYILCDTRCIDRRYAVLYQGDWYCPDNDPTPGPGFCRPFECACQRPRSGPDCRFDCSDTDFYARNGYCSPDFCRNRCPRY